MKEQDDLKLTNEQLVRICEYAEEVRSGRSAETKDVAFCLKAVAICLHRLQAGDPPHSGVGVDVWYDQTIGQKVRMMWPSVIPVAEKLRQCGILN